MRSLITLNVVAGLLHFTAILALQKYSTPALLLADGTLTLLVVVLACWNIAALFAFWNPYRFRSFCPVIVFAISLVFCVNGERYGSRLILAGTPCSPETFLTGQAKTDLKNAAKQILGHSFSRVWRGPDEHVEMVPGHPLKPVPPDVLRIMSRYGFQDLVIDDDEALVAFSYLHVRTWYEYTYTTDPRVPLSSRPPTLRRTSLIGLHCSESRGREIMRRPKSPTGPVPISPLPTSTFVRN